MGDSPKPYQGEDLETRRQPSSKNSAAATSQPITAQTTFNTKKPKPAIHKSFPRKSALPSPSPTPATKQSAPANFLKPLTCLAPPTSKPTITTMYPTSPTTPSRRIFYCGKSWKCLRRRFKTRLNRSQALVCSLSICKHAGRT